MTYTSRERHGWVLGAVWHDMVRRHLLLSAPHQLEFHQVWHWPAACFNTSKQKPRVTHTCMGTEPPKSCPAMALGRVTRPMMLRWLRVGASAAVVALCMMPCVASHLLAPSTSHCSKPSLPAQHAI